MWVNNITRQFQNWKDNRSFARVFLGPTWIQVGFGEPLVQRTPAARHGEQALGKLSDGGISNQALRRCSPKCAPLRRYVPPFTQTRLL